jgi:uncharacterized protein (TIGR02118 family)
MVTVVTLIKRKGGMDVAAFQDYWRTRHPEVVTALPGVRRYVQSHVLPAAYQRGEPPFDGLAEVWADGTDALRAMTASPAYAAVREDEARFIERASMVVLVTEEHVAGDGAVAAGAVKAVELFTRRPGLAVDAFQRHWREVHAPLAAAIPGVARAVARPARAGAYAAGRAPAYDGVALMWLDSLDALRAAAATPEYRALVADRERFLAPGPPPFLLTREHVIVA